MDNDMRTTSTMVASTSTNTKYHISDFNLWIESAMERLHA